MSFTDIFKKSFLSNYANTEITFRYTIVVMVLCLILSVIISMVYYIKSRKYFFSREFMISIVSLSLITAAVILAIQSSIVVSLGMVGALSIVRFRTAIKNPLDLVFLFWAISIGIICGAGLFYIAIGLTLLLGVVILVSDDMPGLPKNKILVIDLSYPYDTEQINECIIKYSKRWNIKTESVRNNEANLILEIRGIKDQSGLLSEINGIQGVKSVAVLSQEGAVD